MAINPTATTTFNEIIVEKTTELLRGRLATGSLIANAVSDMGARQGNTIRYHRSPKGTVQNAVDGTTKTYATPVGAYDELVLEYYKEIPLEAGDLEFTIAGTGAFLSEGAGVNANKYAMVAAEGLAKQIDVDVLERILDDSNIGDATVVGFPETALNDKAFRTIRKTLVKQGVDINKIVILLTPDHSAEAMGIDVFRSADYVGEGDARRVQINGQLPLNVYGMAVYMDIVNLPNTNSVPSISGSSTTQFVSMAMSIDAVKFVMPMLATPANNNATISASNVDGLSVRVKTWYDPDLNTFRVVTDALYGAKTLKTASLQSATDVVSIVPLLGGEA
jgi:hypothetical protein